MSHALSNLLCEPDTLYAACYKEHSVQILQVRVG